jgi:hydroxyacylglutathione hydrolase
VTETHIHADFVSGSRELAARTGATVHVSDEGGPDWTYGFADEAGVTRLKDGDVIEVGNIRLEVMHTPGHTPEHIVFIVTDTAGADRPMGVLTGDFVFVGAVGRPDLLEKAAGVSGSMEGAARQLFASIQRFRELPDFVQIWPAHGAGSACGKSLGAVPQSTLGYEKLFSAAFGYEDESEFVAFILEGQPEPPKYFAEMKRMNRDGPAIVGAMERPARHAPADIDDLAGGGATVIDTRSARAFAAGHVPGAISIPLNKSFNTWAGWLVPYDTDFHLIVDDETCADAIDEAVRDLRMVGLDRAAGWFGSDLIDWWRAEGRAVQTIDEVEPAGIRDAFERGEMTVLDVRGRSEWEAGHLPGVRNIPLGYLAERLDEVPRDRPIVLQCQSGSRSAIGASILQAHGFDDVSNLVGGFGAWKRAGLPVDVEAAAGVS